MMELCAGFTSDRWRELRPKLDGNDKADWEEAIGVLERRLEERFFRCIDALIEREQAHREIIRPGFSIMALCCLLIETLQSFYTGGHDRSEAAEPATPCPCGGLHGTAPPTTRIFRSFLKNSKHFNSDFKNSEIAGEFGEYVRNGLLHEAETRHGWLIERTQPADKIVERNKDGYVINRTNFYRALRKEFEDYLIRLRDPAQANLRRNFLKKMDSICKTEPGIE